MSPTPLALLALRTAIALFALAGIYAAGFILLSLIQESKGK